jgi:hypothetical protein
LVNEKTTEALNQYFTGNKQERQYKLIDEKFSVHTEDDEETLCSIFKVHPKQLVGVKMKSGRARRMQNKWGGE